MTDKPKGKEIPNPEPIDFGGTEQAMTDEEFAYLDRDKDGVVHLHEETIREQYGDTSPAKKARAAAPENKDAAALRDDKADDAPEPIGDNLRPNGRRRK